MKLFDKIKDLFMDEIVEDEEEEEETALPEVKPKKENKKDELPKVMRETIKKEEKKEDTISNDGLLLREEVKKMPVIKEEEVKKPIKTFDFSTDFVEEFPKRKPNLNVMDTISNNPPTPPVISKKTPEVVAEVEVSKKVTELYPKKEEVKPKFKASPVISPVYGVLDKNYKKDEVKEKSEEMVEMKRPSKKVDFETVRRKAFGNLVEDIKDNMLCENCELYKEVKKISALKEDDLLYDMTVDDTKDVTIEKAYDDYEEFGVAYEPKKIKKEDDEQEELLTDIREELDDVKEELNNNQVEIQTPELEIQEPVIMEDKVETFDDNEKENNDVLVEEEPVKDIPTRQDKKKETKVDEDFFELIDSMYKERVDE